MIKTVEISKSNAKMPSKREIMEMLIQNPTLAARELCNRSFYEFFKIFWGEVSSENFKDNWHIEYLCNELQRMAERVALGLPKEYDLIINIPPGTTKSTIVSIMFPAWCWTKWYWMQFICVSYSSALSLEHAEKCRDIVQSDKYKALYPEIDIKDDKNTKSNFRLIKKVQEFKGHKERVLYGGNRFSTSVEGTVTGFHAHIIIKDDPINPHQSASKAELNSVNRWIDSSLHTRKVDKLISCDITVMQRLHEDDPSGHALSKPGRKVKHICLPGEVATKKDMESVKPSELLLKYKDGLLDPIRLNKDALLELEERLGQYGYAGQVLQSPTPPEGGMFKADRFTIIQTMPNPVNILRTVRYWDKAGTKEFERGKSIEPAYTVGVKIHMLSGERWLISDVKRGRWSSEEREDIIRSTAEADGVDVIVAIEQEPGSGGKESAQGTVKRLAGFTVMVELPKGDKVYRADPFSTQVNWGRVLLLQGEWNNAFLDEYRHFPNSRFKDQVDAGSGGFAVLTGKKMIETY